jgi:hypothetical protein
MAKKLIPTQYVLDIDNNTVQIKDNYSLERILIITDVTTNIILYNFADPTKGGSVAYDASTGYTTITLEYDVSAAGSTNASKLQIFVEDDNVNIKPDETYVDPVSKIRVSNPENLIDTDFEYGLQSTKWETLELVKNIPTFFSRNGDEALSVSSINTIANSNDITVTCTEEHGLSIGVPIIVQGTTNEFANGGFIVTSVIDTTTFVYKSKSQIISTGTIDSTYTQVFLGNVYQGTEFRLSQIDSITRSSAGGSNDTVLTVHTEFPAPLSEGTSFFLANSLGVANIGFDSTQTEASISSSVTQTTTNNADALRLGFSKMDVQPYDYTGSNILYFNPSDVTVNQTEDTITFSTAHGLTDNAAYVYVAGEGNGSIITEYRGCIVRVIDATTIYISDNNQFDNTTRRNLNVTTDGGLTRSAFIRAYKVTNIGTSQDRVDFENQIGNIPPFVTDSTAPILFFGTGDGGELRRVTDLKDVEASTNTTGEVLYARTSANANVRWKFSKTPGGAEIDITGSNNSYFAIQASELVDKNTINFPSHSLAPGSFVDLSVNSGSLPTGLSATNYVAEVVNPNTLRFLSNNVPANITSVGANADEYQIDAIQPNVNNDSLFLPGNRLTNGQTVTYLDEGNTTIGGLTDDTSYFIVDKTTDRIKLATTANGYTSGPINGSHTLFDDTETSGSSFGAFNLVSHGISDGEIIQYFSTSPLPGLSNGSYYYAKNNSTNYISLYWNSSLTTEVKINASATGDFTIRRSTIVDITTVGAGTHTVQSPAAGASDGVYSIARVNNSNQFEFDTGQNIPARVITIPLESNADYKNDRLHNVAHGLTTGSAVTYSSTGTPITGLSNDTVYYVCRVNKDWFKLSTSVLNAEDDIAIDIDVGGTGVHTITTDSITGEIAGTGTITFTSGDDYVEGTDTNFTGIFTAGDIFKINVPDTEVEISFTADNATNTFTSAAPHGITTEDAVVMHATTAPTGTTNTYIYYARAVSTTEVTLHPSPADATANTNIVAISDNGSGVVIVHITALGSIVEKDIKYVNSAGNLQFTTNLDISGADYNYLTSTSLIVRSDGFALHRPYDGGVELIPSSNPDSTMIRQTRKYFRYQSGKGIQNSLAVNFSPTTDIDTFSRVGTTGTITTRDPHRLTAGLSISVNNATVTSGTNYWNDTFEVASVIDDYSYTVTLAGIPTDNAAGGIPKFYVESWSNSKLQCGLFDDQNGIFWEFDGSQLYACRRSSIQQLSGTLNVTFRSGLITGTATKFSSQISVGDKVVIKGMTYEISQVDNDTTMYILPTYRGVSQANVIATKTETVRTPQSAWSIDPCDGNGKSGYILDVHRIQMAYIDYSWYGAGKVRYGFKDQNGKVIYVHEYVHNNQFTEAYMRSGNLPGRYQIQNVGVPTYVPALAHWGTSIIMDGRFDDDKAYVFNAQSNNLTLLGAGSSLVVSARAQADTNYQIRDGRRWRTLGNALEIETPSGTLNSLTAGMPISGADFVGSLDNPTSNLVVAQPYQPGVDVRYDNNNATRAVKDLLIIGGAPTGTTASYSNYTVTTSSAGGSSVVRDIPLISIRLSPSVDTNTPGFLGEREIINRMQLILSQVQILTTHAVDVTLVLNGSIDDNNWTRVTNPSLSQLVYHNTEDSIVGGSVIYSFRAQGGTGVAARTPVANTEQLGEVATLGNAILGGNGVYPDGPDVLTVVARITEDPSTVSPANAFEISGRLSWTESQA